MDITSNDIAAQRAMLARGEEKRKAAKQAEERERLRDTFAAAALTGLLSNIPRYQLGVIAVQAYEIADEMIAERSRTGKNVAEAVQQVTKCTERENDHDAVPEARARDADRGRSDKAVTRPGDSTGNTPSPESYEQGDENRVNTTTHRDTTRDECSVRGEGTETLGQRLVERLSITQTLLDDNEQLRAEIARLREAIRRLADQDATLSVQGGSVTVTMDATLTDEERGAIMASQGFWALEDSPHAATLRNLLERLT